MVHIHNQKPHQPYNTVVSCTIRPTVEIVVD